MNPQITFMRVARALLLAAAAVTAATTALPAHAQSLTRIKLSLDWLFEGHTSFLHLARFKGYFEREGLDVSIDVGTGSAGAFQRITSGAYDAGLGDMTSQIEYLARNPGPLQFQAVYVLYDQAPLAFFAMRKTGIRSLRDLPGKTLAETPTGFSKRLWPTISKAVGIDPNSVNWVMVSPTLRATMVMKGEADSAAGFFNMSLDFTSRGVKADEIVAMPLTDYGIQLYGNSLVVSNRLIQSNPRAVAGLVRAFNQALREGLADPALSVKYLKQREPLVNETVEIERFRLVIPAIVTDNTRSAGLGAISKLRLENQVDLITTGYGLPQRPNPDMIFNSSFLPPRAQRLPPEISR